jgi:hypothetical protein
MCLSRSSSDEAEVEIGAREEAPVSEREEGKHGQSKTALREFFPLLVRADFRWRVVYVDVCLCWVGDVNMTKIDIGAAMVATAPGIPCAALRLIQLVFVAAAVCLTPPSYCHHHFQNGH